MLLDDIVQRSLAVAATRSRKKKVALLADLLAATPPEARLRVTAWLGGTLPQGKVGVGPATLYRTPPPPPSPTPSLTVDDLHAACDALGAISGPGAAAERRAQLDALLGAATEAEQRFIAGVLVGEVRQGALDGVLTLAIARAAGVPDTAVRRAAMLAGNLPEIARDAFTGGEAALSRYRLEVFRPIQPMLAQTAEDLDDAWVRVPSRVIEHKLDGARVQVHKDGARVRVYTRQLNDVTAAVPEVVERVAALPDRRLVLDGEVLALRPDGRPCPFQETMRRFGRRLDVAALREELPLSPFFFDCLLRGDVELLDAPLSARQAALDAALPPELCVSRFVADDRAAAERFVDDTLDRGHEGVMIKSLDGAYEAGDRGASWLKLKPTHTLDLVVLAAEWGSGRRRGWLSNLHLGARDGDGFVMLGKTFKGLTDETLAWQTEALQARERRREGHVVHVEPSLVVEIAFNELQESPRYPGGLALRFARVKGYRPDKAASEADTLAAVRRIFAKQRGG